MKTFLVTFSCFAGLIAAQAQSTLDWGNRIPGVLLAPIYGVDPSNRTASRSGNAPSGFPAGTQTYNGALLAGTGFSAQLYFGPAGAPENSLVSVAAPPATFGTGGNAGFYNAGPVVLPGIGSGQSFAVQVRVWENFGTYATYSAAIADDLVPRGMSALLTIDPSSFLPGQTPYLRGLESFQLYIVPEPSVFALGFLGLGVLAALRWSQSLS